ncbi:MAG: ParB family transcriptional regulator, chromosome partitioning protein [Chloroflexota bacterium]|nr:ParB family transcriptional regulator, chromosome partitioning protein [Chloroflexota bacterium]
MARPDFRGTAARRLAEERDLSPAILSLISPEGTERPTGIRNIPLDRIEPNPDQPRMNFDEAALADLASSIREHGVLQPILVRPTGELQRYQLVAGERRWRAAKAAQLEVIPALIEQLDDETALEIGIIENLQREDLSPLEEAMIYDRMTREHGYSVRRLAQKIGKDKGYVENRLRLAGAPTEIKQLVSLRKDTLSHAYELLKVEDAKKRRKLAAEVASGELSLVKLRERIEGRPPRKPSTRKAAAEPEVAAEIEIEEAPARRNRTESYVGDDALINAKADLDDALEHLAKLLGSAEVLGQIGETDRSNLAKYLTIAKLRLENAIIVVRSGRVLEH